MDALARARDWLAQDPDPETRSELEALLMQGNRSEIERWFTGDLQFGTAGLRGPLGCGPLRMNRMVVARAAAGLAQFLLEQSPSPRVVIGYDARHKSCEFARETAGVMQGAGVDTLLLPNALPTPVLAFAVRYLAADGGMMVTASHNPAGDNGYKVYLGDGTQIANPADELIAEHMARVPRVDLLARNTDYTVLGNDVFDAYLDAICETVAPAIQQIHVAYTPMHGVGGAPFLTAAARCGLTEVAVEASQANPDPDFPTLPFPNPEEPGAMDRVFGLAEQVAADIVLAHDPDADRLAVAARHHGEVRLLTGDELGCLLAVALLERGMTGTFASSIVSGTLLGAVAARSGQPWVRTLTGFKWIGKVEELAFGYEEALGYCVRPDVVRDKDGISAALLVLSFANELRAQSRTLIDVLEDLAREFGVFATKQLSIRLDTSAQVKALLSDFAATPPGSIAGAQVTRLRDLSRPDTDLPATAGIALELGPTASVTIRPSGTEPKLKCYLEVRGPIGDDLTVGQARAQAQLDLIETELRALLLGSSQSHEAR